jgi:hypothetical protein
VELASLDEAETYITDTLHPGSEVLSSQATSREYGDGFMVSFADRDPEGNPVSGLAVVLNDEGNLRIADIRYAVSGVDLLQPDEAELQQVDIRTLADTFMLLPPDMIE